MSVTHKMPGCLSHKAFFITRLVQIKPQFKVSLKKEFKLNVKTNPVLILCAAKLSIQNRQKSYDLLF